MSESANSAISATFLVGFEILLWLGWLSDDSGSDGDGLAVLLDDVSFLALDLLGENNLLISLGATLPSQHSQPSLVPT